MSDKFADEIEPGDIIEWCGRAARVVAVEVDDKYRRRRLVCELADGSTHRLAYNNIERVVCLTSADYRAERSHVIVDAGLREMHDALRAPGKEAT